ncbi:hypothetical protein INR49_016354 [Caranx melampygus]|nr:hypothetical protein INR49_016354 [Caranx melampygus]
MESNSIVYELRLTLTQLLLRCQVGCFQQKAAESRDSVDNFFFFFFFFFFFKLNKHIVDCYGICHGRIQGTQQPLLDKD